MAHPTDDPELLHTQCVVLRVQIWLILATITSLALTALILTGFWNLPVKWKILLVCIFAGVLGSAVSAYLSASERYANGWETMAGLKKPQPEPKDKFVTRMAGQFIYRPILGGVMGLVVLMGLTGGYMIAIQIENLTWESFRIEGLAFLSFLSGIFSKTLIDRLRDMFHALFGE